MKCLVLAGGSGDALWPLSRRNYPKQFIHVKKGRSLFQEAIARNLPFCDEYYIVTNYKYENIVRGQLQTFQGLNYHLFLEETGRQTAPAVMVACLCMSPEEQVLVVSTDHRIEGGDYNGTIVKAQQFLEEGSVVAIGCRGALSTGHNYFDVYDDGQVDYMSVSGREEGTCETCMGDSLPDRGAQRFLDSGIFLVHAGTFIKAVKQNRPKLYEACCYGKNRLRMAGGNAVMTREWLEAIPSVSVGEAVYEKWTQLGKVVVVEGDFGWSRLLSLEALSDLVYGEAGNDICHQCQNVSVINEAKEKLVVANDLKDVLIVNTKDAVYVTGKGSSAEIKNILSKEKEFSPQQTAAFDEGDVYYTTWGCKETLSRSEGYLVKKLTIFPGQSLSLHKHEKRSEHWSIVSGTATIVLNGEEKEYRTNESIFVPMGVFHRISNETTKDLVVIEVSIGESVGSMTEDMVHAPKESASLKEKVVRLTPVCKDYLWGGRRLAERYHDLPQTQVIAESWQLSAHPAGLCTVNGGTCDGMMFDAYLERIGKDALGWKCQPYERFPLLVKFIDATDKLSIQVHPEDAYAMAYENDYGKNEMWYILDAEEEAFVYLGFEKDTDREEVQRRIADGTLADILHKVPVKTGDSVFVPAGQIHAIGAGVLILEIQQSSNATYRLYDYNRKDKDGQLRPLHLEKAFANISFKASTEMGKPLGPWQPGKGYEKRLLEQCKYFSVWAYQVEKQAELVMDDSTFWSIVVVSGEGTLEAGEEEMQLNPGDSLFLPAGRKAVRITGECHFVLSHV